MVYHSEELAALIGSRICHDLISPIGAVGNGLELMSMAGTEATPEMALVSDSAANANARILWFRLAFGVASDRQMTRLAELEEIWLALHPDRRLTLASNGPDSVPRGLARMIALGVLCLQEALPRGGAITVHVADHVTLTGSGPTIAQEPAHWDILGGQAAPAGMAPAQVQFLLLASHATQTGRQCSYRFDDAGVRLSF